MRITIAYDSSWRNSFLDGSNNEPLPKGGRNFVGSMTALKTEGNFIERAITKDTVMGVLNRLIGDQRKLYQARLDPNYCLADIESILTDTDIVDKIDKQVINSEVTFLRNMTKDGTSKTEYAGMIKENHPTFSSNYSSDFWGVLWLSTNELFEFISNNNFCIKTQKDIKINPLSVLNRTLMLSDLKLLDCEGRAESTVLLLKKLFPDESYIENSGKIKLIRLYAAALYIQFFRLSEKFDMTGICKVKEDKVYVYGFSKRAFNSTRDFMKNFTTGGEKRIWGNPYLLKQKIKGEGERVSLLTKASGVLEINININKERANELKTLIENAGVSAFYLGKKGLAYVETIR